MLLTHIKAGEGGSGAERRGREDLVKDDEDPAQAGQGHGAEGPGRIGAWGRGWGESKHP